MKLTEKYIKNNKSNLERNIYPFLMEKDINDITSFEMIEIIKKMEAKGIIETAHRVFNLIERIFKYAVTIGKAKRNIMARHILNFGLKRLGFDITSHGFRHTASTLLHENIHIHKIPSEVIEMQLAHSVGNNVHRTYNKALYIEERFRLMEWWCKYLTGLKKVIKLKLSKNKK